MDNIKISQIPNYNSNIIKSMLCGDNTYFPWYYNETTIGNHYKDKHQWTHGLCRDGEITSPYYEQIKLHISPFIPEYLTHKLLRCKVNLNTPYKRKEAILRHIDENQKTLNSSYIGKDSNIENAVSYVYYVNDSDGPTRIFKNWWKTLKIHPKQGRLVRFPSTTSHSGNVPYKFESRIVINFVFIK